MFARRKWLVAIVVAMLILAAVGAVPAGAVGQSGTTLSVSIAADGRWHREYPWSIAKSVTPETLALGCGARGSVTYTVALVKGAGVDKYSVCGKVWVRNGGAQPTEDLNISIRVLYKTGGGPFGELTSWPLDLSAKPVLAPGEEYEYPFCFEFTPVAGALYKAESQVTITNHSGHLGTPFGPAPDDDFSFPGSPTEVNATVHVRDNNVPLQGDAEWNWEFSNSGNRMYDLTFVCPGDAGTHTNIATILETGAGAQATVTVTCEQCQTGCTRTIGYWKTHAGTKGNNADEISACLPIWLGNAGGSKSVQVTTAAQAVSLLSMQGGASNGIVKLYAQLLAAKLSMCTGADGAAVADTVAAADTFLATRNAGDWKGLSRLQQTMVNGWMTTLDNYNNGYIGPGHCD
ncbi:MAG: hypothetical protein ACUVX9_18400 [Anaerolineae bacterium]